MSHPVSVGRRIDGFRQLSDPRAVLEDAVAQLLSEFLDSADANADYFKRGPVALRIELRNVPHFGPPR